MSRPSQLPPRCPLQKKAVVRQTLEPSSISFRGVNTRHHRSLSQSSLTDDQQLAWLDDLLSDSNPVPKGFHHSRSASDSAALLDGVVPSLLLCPGKVNDGESTNALVSGCTYGPNSPRQRSNEEFSDGTALLAMSNYAVSQSPMQFFDEGLWSYGTGHFELNEDCCDAPNDLISEAKSRKRHPGQRSRARKLQYIAELERTVNVFQTLESKLNVRVSTLLQQKVALSLENSKLKQQMTRLQQQKLIMDGEYQVLTKEVDRLKLFLANSRNSKVYSYAVTNDSDTEAFSCESLDWNKLHF